MENQHNNHQTEYWTERPADYAAGERFQYTYSAMEQEEVKRIRSRYLPKEEDKMAQLRKLDAGATQRATTWSLVVGLSGLLTLGIGMCCCLVWAGVWFVPGILIGIVGMTLVGAAFPMYQRILQKEREKIAPEILRLTDELMK